MGAMVNFCLRDKNITAPNYCWMNVVIVSLNIYFLSIFKKDFTATSKVSIIT